MAEALKPVALRAGDSVRVVSISSPVHEDRVRKGVAEIERLGYVCAWDAAQVLAKDGFFAGSAVARGAALKSALHESETRAVICSRGGYGVNYLLPDLHVALETPKLFIGFSDLTSLQIFLWQRLRWVTLYGPMAAAGLDGGAGGAAGYDAESFRHATTATKHGWAVKLDGAEALVGGACEGRILGGCLTLIYTSIGTPGRLRRKARCCCWKIAG